MYTVPQIIYDKTNKISAEMYNYCTLTFNHLFLYCVVMMENLTFLENLENGIKEQRCLN
jgi:hypothetical protein